MKKILSFLPLMLIALIGLGVTACSDKDEPVSPEELPHDAQFFLATYFPDAPVVTSVKDGDEYEVVLTDGSRIDFNQKGEWRDVEAAAGKTIPSGFYPDVIDQYIVENFSGVGINEISMEANGYEVKLVTGIELLFTYTGEYIGPDLN